VVGDPNRAQPRFILGFFGIETPTVLKDAKSCLCRPSQSASSGSAAELHVWQGMVHVFPANLAVLHAAREALDITDDFLRRNLAR
jgi:hypothetical protein